MKWLKYLALGLCIGCSPINPETKNSKNVEKNKREKYALIINANSETERVNSVSLADSVLSENNYNTYILDETKGRDYHVNGISTKENIGKFFQNADIGKDDLFLLFAAGHGSKDTLNKNIFSIINIASGESLDPKSLKKYLKNINPDKGILLFPQCYGWRFGKKFGKDNYIAISLSRKSKPSYGTNFSEGFFKSFNSQKADANNDRKISVLEASVNGCEEDFRTPLCFDYESLLYGKSFEYSHYVKKNTPHNKPRIHSQNTNPRNVYVSEISNKNKVNNN